MLIFDIPLGCELGGRSPPSQEGSATENPSVAAQVVKEGTYATVRIVAFWKTANFQYGGEMRLCVRMDQFHAAHFLIRFPYRLLAVPPEDLNFGSAPFFFCRRRSPSNIQWWKRTKELAYEKSEWKYGRHIACFNYYLFDANKYGFGSCIAMGY